MQPRGSDGRDPFFDSGEPFAGFGGYGGHQSLKSNFFGGKDPFDDPFFARPLGGMLQSNIFGATGQPGQPFLEHQGAVAQGSTKPIIEVLNSDDENEELGKDKEENPRKHGRSSDKPYVEYLEEDVQEKRANICSMEMIITGKILCNPITKLVALLFKVLL